VLGSVTVARTNCKGKKESRTIPLHHQVRTAIEVLVANMEDKHAGAYVFQSQKGGRLSRIQAWRLVKQAARSLGEIRGISPHSFRKFLGASVYRISGRCIVTTQRALGHSSVQWTPIYVGIADAEVKTAILSL
jgi:integrase/recombinase XerD